MGFQQEMLNPSWTDEPLDTSTKIKKIHIEEIRQYLEELTSATGCLQDYSHYRSTEDYPYDASLDSGFHNGENLHHRVNENGTYESTHRRPWNASEHSPYHNNVETGYRNGLMGTDNSPVYAGRDANLYRGDNTTFNTCAQDYYDRRSTRNVHVYTSVNTYDFDSDFGAYYSSEMQNRRSGLKVSFCSDVEGIDRSGARSVYGTSSGGSEVELTEALYDEPNFSNIRDGQRVACQAHNYPENMRKCDFCYQKFSYHKSPY